MRFDRDKRYQIKALLNVGLLQKDIANPVGMTPGAHSKELRPLRYREVETENWVLKTILER